MAKVPRMYSEIAAWWPLLSAPADYEGEAGFYTRTLQEATDPPARTVLELGSGGGNNASFMKRHFEMTLVDLSEEMLAVSRSLNPELEHLQGDMRSIRLDREFDAVFVHDAVCYMTSAEDLGAAIETAYIHARPGGAALFCPDFVRETFVERTDHGGHDEGTKAMRYLDWTWDPDPTDPTYLVDYAFILREADGTTRSFHEQHVEGLFGRDEWLGLMRDAGFDAEMRAFDLPDEEVGLEVVLGRKPA